MSKKITIHFDPRNPDEAAQVIAATARAMDASVVFSPQSSETEAPSTPKAADSSTRPDEQLAQKVGDVVRDHLDAKQAKIEAERAKAPGGPTPEQRAKDIIKARKSLAEICREEGIKFTIQVVFKTVWEHRQAIADAIKQYL